MQNSTDSNSRSSPQSGGVITRAESGPGNDTAQPSLTSGFGAVIEKEHNLQSATEGSFGNVSGHRSTEVDRILHHQHARLGANIALLEQRYEALPKSERFVNWREREQPSAKPRSTQRDETELLPNLVAQHTRLLGDIEALIGCAPDGLRGELMLAEVSRSHEEMASMLTTLLKDDELARPIANERSRDSSGGTKLAQENWDNEGGPAPIDPLRAKPVAIASAT